MAALVELVPVAKIGEPLLGPAAGGAGRSPWGRSRRPTGAGRPSRPMPAEALPVQAGRRGAGGGQPVEHHVVEQLVPGQHVLGVAVAVGPGPELLDDPGRLAGRRVDQAVAQGLRSGRLLLGVARSPSPGSASWPADGRLLLVGQVAIVVGAGRDDRHVEVDRRRMRSASCRRWPSSPRPPSRRPGPRSGRSRAGHQLRPRRRRCVSDPSPARRACR